jgi:hypothetical protein
VESKNSPSKHNKDYWTYLADNYKEVSSWPTWMRGETRTIKDDGGQKQTCEAEKKKGAKA